MGLGAVWCGLVLSDRVRRQSDRFAQFLWHANQWVGRDLFGKVRLD